MSGCVQLAMSHPDRAKEIWRAYRSGSRTLT